MSESSPEQRPDTALIESFRARAVRIAGRHGVSLFRRRKLRSLRVRDAAYVGLLVTAFILFATSQDWLWIPEQWMYDLRTKFCRFDRPAPTDRLVHLDIDDRSLDDIGRWPWPRATQAAILDELAAAHPRAVALDILYDQPEKKEYVPQKDDTFLTIDNDSRFETALRKMGSVILPFDHSDDARERPKTELYTRMTGLLVARPTMDEKELLAQLATGEQAMGKEYFLRARSEAVSQFVKRHMAEGDPSLAEVMTAVKGGVAAVEGAAFTERGPVERLVEEAWQAERARRVTLLFRVTAPSDVITRLDSRPVDLIPIEPLARAAAMTAFVTYNKDGDGIMRRVPVLMNSGQEGGATVNLGLALALRTLGVSLKDVTVEKDRMLIRMADRTIEVPLRTVKFEKLPRAIGGVMDLTFLGRRGADTWQTMYDPPGVEARHTMSVSEVWQSVQTRRKIAANNEQLREACLTMLGDTNLSALAKRPYDPYDPEAWTAQAKDSLDAIGPEELAALDANPPKDTADEQSHREFLVYRAIVSAKSLVGQMPALKIQAETLRAKLADKLGDKAILMGWTATGRTDFVATPLHPACAGVRIHGLVFNAIMTGNFLRFAPLWLTLLCTGVLGVASTWAVMKMNPAEAWLTAFGLALIFTAANVILFGYHGYVLGLAAPLHAIAATWVGGSVIRYIIERGDRQRIIRRFQTYVDPQLVNYLLQNPDRLGLEGERRRMTVVFTDLAGFTTLSERLGEQTVGILNEYFSVMVPLVRKHQGYVNKLLGDGMMFFFNAPQPNDRHAGSAFDSVIEMQAAVKEFNRELAARDLPVVKMRVGITTGNMIAGDAGGGGYNDFTVLGDVVNLSARLESANKASGTLILCNRASMEAAGDSYLTRPVGVLRVVGKTEGVETFEVMCAKKDAQPEQLVLAEMTAKMVDAYKQGNLDLCCEAATKMNEHFKPSPLTALYMSLCASYRETGLPEKFDGTIILDSK